MNIQTFEQMLNKPVLEWKRFHYCQAWYGTSTDGTVIIFKSYATRIGFIWDGVFLYKRKYSRTTTRQMTRFAREHCAEVANVG